jgi:transposase
MSRPQRRRRSTELFAKGLSSVSLGPIEDAAYPAHTAIKLTLDNNSAHISKGTKAWLTDQPAHRFKLAFTPKHCSRLNIVDGFFSKLARSVLRIRVASKPELNDRIMAAMDYFNQDPVVHTSAYKLDKAA